MLATAQTCAVIGLDGQIIQAETDISPGLPAFHIVGLPDTAVQEAKERVRAAVRNSGCEFPMRRITVNLAPADLKKAGPAYDLPIAVGILFSTGQALPPVEPAIFLGELSLDGGLRHTAGILPMVWVAREQGIRSVFVPAVDAAEAALVEGMQVYPVATLAQLLAHLHGEAPIEPFPTAASISTATATRPTIPTWPTSAARTTPSAPWKWPPPAFTTSCSAGRPAPAKPCWPAPCPASCPT